MKYGFSAVSPFPQPNGQNQASQLLHGLEEEVQFLPGTAIRVWYTHLGTSYPAHWHPCLEIVQCVHAFYTVHTEKKDHHVSAGDILVLPPGVKHDLVPASDCNGWIYLIGLEWLERIPTCRALRERLGAPLMISREAAPARYARVAGLLELMRTDYFSDNPLRELLFDSSMLRLMEQLLQLDEPHNREASQLDKRHDHGQLFDQVVQYIDGHFAEDLTLTGLSHRFNLSSAYFSRLFKQYTQDTFSHFLAARRFQEADRLLMDPSISITEVAARCGYDNPAVFTRAYANQHKYSPSKFRHIYSRLEKQGEQRTKAAR